MGGLVYVGRVEELNPIENADRIVSATTVCGEGGRWTGVVQKGQFDVGQPCVVYLQDSIVPESEEMAFLKSTGWRVKMQRFRGSPSECVIRPLKIEGDPLPIGTDLTIAMGVTKYEKTLPLTLGGDALGHFPQFIPKTDEPNFQSGYRILHHMNGKPWRATVKCDGTSLTVYRHEGKFGVCSRNFELAEGGNVYWQVAKKFNLPSEMPDGFALQLEVVGPGIQKNRMGLSEVTGLAFSLWNIGKQRYEGHKVMHDFCEFLKVPQCDLAASGESFDFDAEGLRKLAEGTYPNGVQREGVVIRTNQDDWGDGGRLSVKSLNLLYKD